MRDKTRILGVPLLAAVLCVFALAQVAWAQTAFAQGAVVGGVPVKVDLSGTFPALPEEFAVVLEADAPESPLPEGSAGGAYELKVVGSGAVNLAQIPEIRFERVGIHDYTVYQRTGENPHCAYDATVYHLRISVFNGEDGSLRTEVSVRAAGETEKRDEIAFRNVYDTLRSLTVSKLWSDNGKNRPDRVTVQLLDSGEVVSTVTLGAWNDWMHTWTELVVSETHDWQVREVDVPAGYKASYLVNGDYVTVRNTESLIQTGQLNWPIPVLAGAGLVLVLVGAFALRRKKPPAEKPPSE